MESKYPHPIPLFMVQEINRRPNPELERQLEEGHGGPVEVVDWLDVATGRVVAEAVSEHGLPWGACWWSFVDDPWPKVHPHAGPNLWIMTPCGAWSPDQRARNCGWPDDDEHYCWARTGGAPAITVENGPCPSGGAGSLRCWTFASPSDTYSGRFSNDVERSAREGVRKLYDRLHWSR